MIEFAYRNYRGEIAVRKIEPTDLAYQPKPGYDYQPGWALSGIDLERDARRTFFLPHIILPTLQHPFILIDFKESK